MTSSLSAVKRASHHATMWAAARDVAIRKAHTEGHTLREIAQAAGLSHARIFQIVRQEH